MNNCNLQTASNIIKEAGINGFRICFETAQWLSSDGKIKEYYHVHVQHDDYPEYNSGVGASNIADLKNKIKTIIVPELKYLIKWSLGNE